MQSYSDIVVASKCPRNVLERNVIGRGTRRGQSAHSSTQIVSCRLQSCLAVGQCRESIYVLRLGPCVAMHAFFDKYRDQKRKRGGDWQGGLEIVELNQVQWRGGI